MLSRRLVPVGRRVPIYTADEKTRQVLIRRNGFRHSRDRNTLFALQKPPIVVDKPCNQISTKMTGGTDGGTLGFR